MWGFYAKLDRVEMFKLRKVDLGDELLLRYVHGLLI